MFWYVESFQFLQWWKDYFFIEEANLIVAAFKCALSVVMSSDSYIGYVMVLQNHWKMLPFTTHTHRIYIYIYLLFLIFLFSFFPHNRIINKVDYSGFYYYVKAILKHLTICLMAGNTFLMVTLDKILSICYGNSNQTAKRILQRCDWDCSPVSYQ